MSKGFLLDMEGKRLSNAKKTKPNCFIHGSRFATILIRKQLILWFSLNLKCKK